jgi:hypothetical protein
VTEARHRSFTGEIASIETSDKTVAIVLHIEVLEQA